jgi:molybdate-binding protein
VAGAACPRPARNLDREATNVSAPSARRGASHAGATAADLDFVPLAVERIDLLMRQRDSYRPPLAAFLALLRSPVFAA